MQDTERDGSPDLLSPAFSAVGSPILGLGSDIDPHFARYCQQTSGCKQPICCEGDLRSLFESWDSSEQYEQYKKAQWAGYQHTTRAGIEKKEAVQAALAAEKARGESATAEAVRKALTAEKARGESATAEAVRKALTAEKARGESATAEAVRKARTAEKARGESATAEAVRKARTAEKARSESATAEAVRKARIAEKARGESATAEAVRKARIAEKARGESATAEAVRVVKEQANDKEEVAKLKAQLANERALSKKQRTDSQALHSALAAAKNQVHSGEQNETTLKAKIDALKHTLEAERTASRDSGNTICTLNTQVAQLQNNAQVLRGELTDAKEGKKQLTRLNCSLRHQLDTLQCTLASSTLGANMEKNTETYLKEQMATVQALIEAEFADRLAGYAVVVTVQLTNKKEKVMDLHVHFRLMKNGCGPVNVLMIPLDTKHGGTSNINLPGKDTEKWEGDGKNVHNAYGKKYIKVLPVLMTAYKKAYGVCDGVERVAHGIVVAGVMNDARVSRDFVAAVTQTAREALHVHFAASDTSEEKDKTEEMRAQMDVLTYEKQQLASMLVTKFDRDTTDLYHDLVSTVKKIDGHTQGEEFVTKLRDSEMPTHTKKNYDDMNALVNYWKTSFKRGKTYSTNTTLDDARAPRSAVPRAAQNIQARRNRKREQEAPGLTSVAQQPTFFDLSDSPNKRMRAAWQQSSVKLPRFGAYKPKGM